MKLSANLLQAISVGIAISIISSSCEQEEEHSRDNFKKEKLLPVGKTGLSTDEKKELTKNAQKEKEMSISIAKNCPTCGMG
ncbi:MAG: hypothetical protein ACO1N0_16490 [Fluviicola sp.]